MLIIIVGSGGQGSLLPLIYVFIIIKYGIKTPAPVRTSHQALPLRHQAHPSNKHQGETALHIHHPLHIPSLQSDSHLRSAARVRYRPLHVDACYPGFQQRYLDVVGSVTRHLGRLDLAAVDRCRHNNCGYEERAGFQAVLGFAETSSYDLGLRIGICTCMVGIVRQPRSNRASKCHLDRPAVDGLRLHCNFTRRNVAERIWARLRCIFVHRRQYMLEHPMEEPQSNHSAFRVRHRVLGCPDRPSASSNNQTQQNLSPVPGILPNFQSQPSQPARNRGRILPSNIPARFQSQPETLP